MALKSTQTETKEESALTLLGAPNDIAKMLAGDGFLPSFKIVHPIESNKFIGKAVIVANADDMRALKAPYHIGVLNARRAARVLLNARQELASKDDKDAKYKRAYEGAKTHADFVKMQELHATDARYQVGKSILLAVWQTPEAAAIVTAELYNTQLSYIQKPLGHAIVANKAIVVVKLEDHLDNVVSGKDDKTKKFFKGDKFKRGEHWEQLEMTKQFADSLHAATEENLSAIKAWMSK